MSDWLERTTLLIGQPAVDSLSQAHVLIVGLGGIGSFSAEFIARVAPRKMTLIDGDAFDPTNKNRQLTALDSTIGRNKARVLAERIADISPKTELLILEEFVEAPRVWEILQEDRPDIVLECIDSVTPKLEWLIACKRLVIPIISHMGAGGKMDPTRVKVAPLEKVHNCQLAAAVKKRLKRKNISFRGIKAVFSSELQQKHSLKLTDGLRYKKSFYGTISYMPALFGLHGAAEAIKILTQKK